MQNLDATASIENFKPFQNLSETSLALLGRGVRYAHFQDTTPVLQKGQQVSGAYVVVQGQLRVFTVTPDGNEATLYIINTGETCVLAINCIFNDLLYPAWVEAGPSSKVAVIPGPVYRILFESEPSIRNMTVQAFSTIVFKLMTELEEIHSYKLGQRLANFLLLHASTDGNVRMTQQEIASHLGTSREVVARVLSHLTAEGKIQTGRNHIYINDPISLAQFARSNEANPKKIRSTNLPLK